MIEDDMTESSLRRALARMTPEPRSAARRSIQYLLASNDDPTVASPIVATKGVLTRAAVLQLFEETGKDRRLAGFHERCSENGAGYFAAAAPGPSPMPISSIQRCLRHADPSASRHYVEPYRYCVELMMAHRRPERGDETLTDGPADE